MSPTKLNQLRDRELFEKLYSGWAQHGNNNVINQLESSSEWEPIKNLSQNVTRNQETYIMVENDY